MFLSARCASACMKWAVAGPSAPVEGNILPASVCVAWRKGKKPSGGTWWHGKMPTLAPMQLVSFCHLPCLNSWTPEQIQTFALRRAIVALRLV